VTVRVLSRRQRVRAVAIAALVYPIIRCLGLTFRWRVEGTSHYETIRHSGLQPVFAFWHGRILPATYFWRGRGIVVMTSANFDGEWIARIIEWFGYGTARGSTSRGGARAMVRLRREMRAGRPAAFTVDGPRGPARSVHPGAVWLASLTGSPILPFHIEATRGWTTRSWDRTLVPKPFSRVAVVIGEPIAVPRGADQACLESCRSTLEQRLSALSDRALELVGRDVTT
jgi:lysophospholipid acyltransferase (LPLAT)-like uncharacterized protein